MNALLHPVGRHPARVYWVRRGVLLVLGVLVLAVTWTLARSGAGLPAGPQDAAAMAGDQAAPEAPAGPGACAPADLAVTLVADGRTYPAGAEPSFTVSVTNVGEAPCTADVGSAQQRLTVTSGSDRIWSSADCPADVPAESLMLLEPGARSDSVVRWTRVRSAEGCPADLPAPLPGTYSAVVEMLGATSAAAVFELA